MQRTALCIVLLFLALAPLGAGSAAAPALASGGAVILADPADPYYPLAEEIALRDGLSILHSVTAVLAENPQTLMWVVSPDRLSDAVLLDFASALRGRPTAISLGIISGGTLDDARNLWLRSSQVAGGRFVSANAANPSGNIDPKIVLINNSGSELHPLTKPNLLQALANADYLNFTGHGGRRYLRLDDDTVVKTVDLPLLTPVVVSTGSCNTFRIWEDESIALGFATRGAAAYAGFAYSPNEGYLIGEFDGLPFRYTWADFTIGDVVQVQNNGTLQGFADLPFYFLLGDPRIALQDEAPYRLVSDLDASEGRVLHFADAPAGFIPVRIPDGAAYGYVEIPGVTSASDSDPFYNSRLQMANIGPDKYILFDHRGGDFTVRIVVAPGWLWLAGDVVADALDTALIYDQQTGGDIMGVVAGGLAWLVIGVRLRRKKVSARALPAAALAGLVFAVLHGTYALARVDQVTITSKIVRFAPLSVLGTFLLASAGAFLYLNARRWLGRVVALLIASFSCLAPALFALAMVGIMNLLVFLPNVGVSLYNYNLGLQPLIAAIVQGVLLVAAFSFLRTRFAGNLTKWREKTT